MNPGDDHKYKYCLIEFNEKLPYENIPRPVFVPKSWIRFWSKDTESMQFAVAYPTENMEDTSRRVRNLEGFSQNWGIYVATIVGESDQFYDIPYCQPQPPKSSRKVNPCSKVQRPKVPRKVNTMCNQQLPTPRKVNPTSIPKTKATSIQPQQPNVQRKVNPPVAQKVKQQPLKRVLQPPNTQSKWPRTSYHSFEEGLRSESSGNVFLPTNSENLYQSPLIPLPGTNAVGNARSQTNTVNSNSVNNSQQSPEETDQSFTINGMSISPTTLLAIHSLANQQTQGIPSTAHSSPNSTTAEANVRQEQNNKYTASGIQTSQPSTTQTTVNQLPSSAGSSKRVSDTEPGFKLQDCYQRNADTERVSTVDLTANSDTTEIDERNKKAQESVDLARILHYLHYRKQ